MLVSVFAVWVVNVIYAFGQSPIPNMDISPIAFSLVAASMAWGFFRYYLLDILPVAKDEIFNSLNEPILVLDEKYRVVDLNPAGAAFLEYEVPQAIGRGIELLFDGRSDVIEHLKKSDSAEVSMTKAGRESVYDLRMYNLSDRKQRPIGRLAVWRDITEQKWMEQELVRLAKTDPLTGAANRRHVTELATAEFFRAKRHGRELSAVMIDIDHFKEVNDTYGHDADDDVLKLLVSICLKELRGGDLFGRYGGEEFVAILTETDMTRALQVAERLRIEIAGQVLERSDRQINITVSLGVSELETEDTDFQDLLKRADQALYRAKTAGRNCVHSAGAFC
jgi:diguanylate cyclase (GGDEF)-like protein/PAS domain S-box-containing protein